MDFSRFFKLSNPSYTLDLNNQEDARCYVDFTPVRGDKVIDQLKRTITVLHPDEPTCQLFTGHIGCGKTTELLKLEQYLRHENFYVIYCKPSQDLVMNDVDVTDVLLALAHQISENFKSVNLKLSPKGFGELLLGAIKRLKEIDVSFEIPAALVAMVNPALTPLGNVGVDAKVGAEGEFSLSTGIGAITAKTKNSTEMRSLLRQYLEPRTDTLIAAINNELLKPAIEQLKQRGKNGLVLIIDNLDRVANVPKNSQRSQPEYLFVDRGDQLKQLKCHIVYTMPLVLLFSNDLQRLQNTFGAMPKLLPMVRAKLRDNSDDVQGMALLRKLILARAFPELEPPQRLTSTPEIFDTRETLDRLCRVSGGHVSTLMRLLHSCLEEDNPPISRACLEDVIRRLRDQLVRGIDVNDGVDEWELLKQVAKNQKVKGEREYQVLLSSMFVFEYQDEKGTWYFPNPILAEILATEHLAL